MDVALDEKVNRVKSALKKQTQNVTHGPNQTAFIGYHAAELAHYSSVVLLLLLKVDG